MKRNIPAMIAVGILIVAVGAHLLLFSAAQQDVERLKENVEQLNDSLGFLRQTVDSLKAQTPGLGDYMSTIQLHIAKMWFAGRAANWKLAGYEHDELEETIMAAEALHAKKNSVDVSAALRSLRETQLPLIAQAVDRKNLRSFENAYNQTLAACNGCHRPAGYEFIHIITPTRGPVTNQQWKMNTQ